MIEFGKTLKAAREARGLTIAQVADATRMMHSVVEGLENEDFSRIAAPIYGRGFVKLYCEAVGLDPKPMVAEYMEISNGNRDLTIKERKVEPAPESSEPEPIPEPAPKPLPAETPDLFTPPEQTAVPKSGDPIVPSPSLSRYATPVRANDASAFPASIGRWAVIGICALAVLCLAAIGLRALYRATSATPPTPVDALDATKTESKPKTSATKTGKPPRTPQEIPPLYMD